VTRAAAQVAAIPGIREELLPIQQAFGRRTDVPGVVAEGRDLGTIVFPAAEAKFFFHADAAERARRRHAELLVAGRAQDLAATRSALDARDDRDQTREVAPLVAPQDAVVIDTTQLSIDEVVERMLAVIEARSADRG
jgi:cytidylate kinase